ncbi:MAG: RHS repeat-associated core domain-containing protein [Acidobacteria bacterium]|nr:RHS repeat-associated core domain-containing protein [Acidobacteriota bacterium]
MSDPFGYGAQWGYYTDRESGLQLLTHRYYDPQSGRFLTRDPIGYRGGINLYAYVNNSPVNFADPSGLYPTIDDGIIGAPPPPSPSFNPVSNGASIFVCSRLTEPPERWLDANHAYLYDNRDERTCGLSGPRFAWPPFFGSTAPEKGPQGGDPCRPVLGSDDPMRANIIMDTCRDYGAPTYIPWYDDCHNMVDSSIKNAGLKNPGAPGARFGDRCVVCPVPQLTPPEYPCWGHSARGC